MKKSLKIVIPGLIILIVIIYLIITGFKNSGVYYLEVSELMKHPSQYINKGLRVSGLVEQGSVVEKRLKKYLEFNLVDEKGGKLKVIYKGIIPDAFKEGVGVIVEGKLNKDYVFNAKTLLAKCPSKYEAEVKEKN